MPEEVKPVPPPAPKRLIRSDGPVNRRTARTRRTQDQVSLPQVVRRHVTRLQNRHQMGAPLMQRLRAVPNRARPSRVPWLWGLALPGGLGMGVAWWWQGVMGWLFWCAGVCVLMGLWGAWWQHWRVRTQAPMPDWGDGLSAPVFDAATLVHVDRVLAATATEVSPAQAQALQRLVDTVVRVAPLLGRVGVNEVFTQEDHFYVGECVRRYLPDSLLAYLQVPTWARAVPVDAQTPSPDALLLQQLQQMQTRLSACEQALGQVSTEALQRQQRFFDVQP